MSARGSAGRSRTETVVFVRVVRFSDVTAERVETLVARIDAEGGPPPGVPIVSVDAGELKVERSL
jgi:hypothetical protein